MIGYIIHTFYLKQIKLYLQVQAPPKVISWNNIESVGFFHIFFQFILFHYIYVSVYNIKIIENSGFDYFLCSLGELYYHSGEKEQKKFALTH